MRVILFCDYVNWWRGKGARNPGGDMSEIEGGRFIGIEDLFLYRLVSDFAEDY